MDLPVCIAGRFVIGSSTGCPQRYPQAAVATGDASVPEVFCQNLAFGTRGSTLGALPDAGGEFFDLIEDLAAFGHLTANFAFGVHHRGVVAAEGLADLG